MNSVHVPVLLNEVLLALNPKNGKTFLDATFGGGGHAIAIAQEGAKVVALDQDPIAVREGERLLSQIACPASPTQAQLDEGEPKSFSFPGGGTIVLINSPFSQLDDVLSTQEIKSIDGALFDLGLSSDQLVSGRGFSFQEENAPLDMRMDPQRRGVMAKDLLAAFSEKELAHIFVSYAQESQARPIAKAIVKERREKPLETSGDLVRIIESVKPKRKTDKIHPATQVFQALRIAVNSELDELLTALGKAWEFLKPGGVLAAISFHSGEDRIVKQFAQRVTGKRSDPISASQNEVVQNPRSRSAKMRVVTKL